MTSHNFSYCAFSLAAIVISPSAVRNVPDGAAVKFSFPIGTGMTAALRKFDTTQPIEARVASRIDTSIMRPRPVERVSTREAQIESAAVIPPRVSHIGYPTRNGALS